MAAALVGTLCVKTNTWPRLKSVPEDILFVKDDEQYLRGVRERPCEPRSA